MIGVDSDQSAAYAENGDTATAEHIVTSMVKNVGDAIFMAIQKDLNGELQWGNGREPWHCRGWSRTCEK